VNGAFDFWQRGTSFTNPAAGSYTADRWRTAFETSAPTSYTVSRQTFTPGTQPDNVAGEYFWRGSLTTLGLATAVRVSQRIEDVSTFANQTATFSFYAKSDTTRTQTINADQIFGSGGSTAVTLASQTITTTTSWQRFTLSFSFPSITGKTLGAGHCVQVTISQNTTNGSSLDLFGTQFETGVVSPFRRNADSIQGELAACQRYFQRIQNNALSFGFLGICSGTTIGLCVHFPTVEMRVSPTVTFDSIGNFALTNAAGTRIALTALTADQITKNYFRIRGDVASGLVGGNATVLQNSAPGVSYIMDMSAEL
jgi:hypothetical protein